MNQILTMREKRASLWDAAKKYRDSHIGNDGTMSAEDAAVYDRMVDDVDRMKKEIDRLERQEAIENEMNRPAANPIVNRPENLVPGEERKGRASTSYNKAFWQNIRAKSVPHEVFNALQVGTDSEGGFLAPDEYEHMTSGHGWALSRPPRATSYITASSSSSSASWANGMYYSEFGDELKRFNTRDGIGRAKIDFPEELDKYIGSMQLLSSIVTTVFVVVCLVFIEPLTALMDLDRTQLLLLLAYLFFSPAINFVQTGYRFRYKYKQNIAIAAFVSLGSVALSLILMLSLEGNKATYRIIGMVVPTICISFFFWTLAIKSGNISINREFWRYGVSLSAPLILHTISINALSQMDRIFITKFCGSSMTGLYSLASNYTVLLSIVTNAVAEGWLPWFHDTYHAGKYDAIRSNVKDIVVL